MAARKGQRTRTGVLGIVGLAALIAAVPLRAEPDNPLVAAHEMINAWNAVDPDAIADMFAEDAVFQGMMHEPVVGREALRERFSALLEGVTALELRLLNMAAMGNSVFIERLDVFTVNGKEGQVPVACVMEIVDGKVQVWREYYDRASLLREMGVSEADH